MNDNDNMTMTYRRQLTNITSNTFKNALRVIRDVSRITVICLESVEARRNLMISIVEEGMDSNEYMWLLLETRRLGFDKVWKDTNPVPDGKDSVALQGAQKFFVIDSEPLNSSAQFAADVKAKMKLPPYNCKDCDVIDPIAVLGTASNCLVATLIPRLVGIRSQFSRLIVNQSIGEAIMCIVFGFYYSPMVFFDVDVMKNYSYISGVLLLIGYDVCLFSRLIIAINRMCSICSPMNYHNYFSERNTSILIACTWIEAIVVQPSFHLLSGCEFFYRNEFWAFTFREDKICGIVSTYFDFIECIVLVVVILIIDIITVAKARHFLEKTRTGYRMTSWKRQKELQLLKQVIAQSGVFASELLTYFIVRLVFTSKWAVWSLTTAAWVTVHFIDSYVH